VHQGNKNIGMRPKINCHIFNPRDYSGEGLILKDASCSPNNHFTGLVIEVSIFTIITFSFVPDVDDVTPITRINRDTVEVSIFPLIFLVVNNINGS